MSGTGDVNVQKLLEKSQWQSRDHKVFLPPQPCGGSATCRQCSFFFSEKGMMCFGLLCSKLGFSLEKLNKKF